MAAKKKLGWVWAIALIAAVCGVGLLDGTVKALPGPYPSPWRSIDARVNRMVWDPINRIVYGSVPASAESDANSIIAISVDSFAITKVVATGTNPGLLALSDDGSRLFVYIELSRQVREYALPDLTLIREFGLGSADTGSLHGASSLAVEPGTNSVLAVSMTRDDAAYAPGVVSGVGVGIFDNGVRRPEVALVTGVSLLAWGDVPNRLYSYELGGILRPVQVHAQGATTLFPAELPPLTPGNPDIVLDSGRLVTGWSIVDPEPSPTVTLTVRLPTIPEAQASDLARHRLYYTYTNQLNVYDSDSGAQVDTFSFPNEARFGGIALTRQLLRIGSGEFMLSQGLGANAGRILLLRPDSIRGSAGEYTPLTPSRLLDTRDGTGRAGTVGPVGPGQSIDVQIAGNHGVPEAGVDSVVLNATVTEPTSSGFITIWPTGSVRPAISNLNFTPGLTVPNLVTVALGDNGRLSVFNSSGSSHVIFDVAGFYSTGTGPPGARFHSVTPKRLFDTRTGEGGVRRALGTGESLQFDVRGKGGLPTTGVVGIAINVTAVAPTQSGYLTVSPADVPRPVVSNLNFVPGQVVPNLVIVRVPASGLVEFFNFAGATDVIADVVGFYDLDRSTQHGRFVSYAPYRVFDTREQSPFSGDGRVPPASIIGFGFDDEPATTYVLNVTITGPSSPGYLTVYPFRRPLGFDNPIPDTSNLNFVAGQTVPNLVMVKTGGSIGMYNPFGYTHVIVDFFGEFT